MTDIEIQLYRQTLAENLSGRMVEPTERMHVFFIRELTPANRGSVKYGEETIDRPYRFKNPHTLGEINSEVLRYSGRSDQEVTAMIKKILAGTEGQNKQGVENN